MRKKIFIGIHTFAFGKFVALFSILFGLGFVIQWERAQARGVRFIPFYLRRLAGLLIIALVAYIHIPMGDALILYALFGTLLLVACCALLSLVDARRVGASETVVQGFALYCKASPAMYIVGNK